MTGKAASSTERHFASDNYAGICPEAWAAMSEANRGHEVSYGNDRWTEKAANLIRDIFETNCEVYFVFNGTSSNSLALAAICQSYHSILCHEIAHIEGSECGAPEFFANGAKVLLLGGDQGKIDPATIDKAVNRRTDIHFPKAQALSITQATEVGTVYSVAELDVLHEAARRYGLRIHMDGARFANAVAHLGVPPKEITWKRGVDVLCFGGTKNGIGIGEAVVFFNKELSREFDYRCKQGGQLASKMRFLSAPWVGVLEDGAWLKHARHSNAMAARLDEGLRKVPSVRISYPVESNAVFAHIPEQTANQLHKRGWKFYTRVGGWEESRLMCSWDTTPDDVDRFVADITELAALADSASC
jgi:threonine aldolase